MKNIKEKYSQEEIIKLIEENNLLKSQIANLKNNRLFDLNSHEQVVSKKELEKITSDLIKSEADYKQLAKSLENQVIERTNDLLQAKNETDYQRNKLEKLFLRAPAGIAILYSSEHIYEFVNPEYEIIFGKKEYLGKGVKSLFPELENQGVHDLLDNVFQSGKTFVDQEFRALINYNGEITEKYYTFILQPILDDNGKPERMGIFIFDVSIQTFARKKVEELSKELERSNADLNNFALIASHDLQEPLRTIASYTKLLGKRYKDKLDNNAKDFINIITDSANRMQKLIQNLLDYSKVNNENDFKELDLNEIVKNIVNTLDLTITETKAVINYKNLPIINAIEVQVYQLMQNFITNALKYHKEASPVIDISAIQEESYWHIKISDNGIGIEEKDFDKIFIIFNRLHGGGEFAGSGVGLATVKKIIDIHQGKVWVESKLGVGSTFHFTIPV